MVVKCPKCGSANIVMTAKVEVNFRFDDNGNVILLSDVSDDVYWNVEYGVTPATCCCHDCGQNYTYKEWEDSVTKGERNNE